MISCVGWSREGARICRHRQAVLTKGSGRMLDFLSEYMISRGLLISLRRYVGKYTFDDAISGTFMCKDGPQSSKLRSYNMRAEESLRRNIGGSGELLEAQAICINTQCGEEGKLQFVR